MKFRTILTMIAASLLFVGCCSCRSKSNKVNKPLVQTQWQLSQINGQEITPTESKYTIQFDSEGRIGGLGDCNRLMADYTTTESRALKIGAIAGTRMMCRDAKQEALFFSTLSKATHYAIDGDSLILLDSGEIIAIFSAK